MKKIKGMRKDDTLDITESSGNVFADLDIGDSEEHFAKAKLAHQINKIIDKRCLTQTEAAKLLGVDQPKISALSRGRLSGFSIERLFKYLALLDQDIEVVVKPHQQSRRIVDSTHLHVRFV